LRPPNLIGVGQRFANHQWLLDLYPNYILLRYSKNGYIDFESAGDDNLEPRSQCGRVDQSIQAVCTTLSIPTLVECVNDNSECIWIRVMRNGANELKEESVLH